MKYFPLTSPLAQDKLNGLGLYEYYLLIIQTGTAQLLEFPERKETLKNDWREENGEENDLQVVRFKDKQVELQCIMLGADDADFWNRYDTFFAQLTRPGLAQLYIHDHSKTYNCFYLKSSNFKKSSKRLKNVDVVVVKFSITLQVKF